MKFDHLKDLPKAESLLAMEILWQSLSQNPTEDLPPPGTNRYLPHDWNA